MKDFQTPNKKLLRLLLLGIGAVVFLLFASHPELRLFIPFFEAFGLDLFVVMVASQIWTYIKPSLLRLYTSLVRPTLHALYALVAFFLGMAGPHLDAQVTSRFPSLKLQSSNALTLPLASVVIGVLLGPLPGTALHTSPSWAGPVITGTAFTMLLLALLLGSTIINIIRSKGRDVAV